MVGAVSLHREVGDEAADQSGDGEGGGVDEADGKGDAKEVAEGKRGSAGEEESTHPEGTKRVQPRVRRALETIFRPASTMNEIPKMSIASLLRGGSSPLLTRRARFSL